MQCAPDTVTESCCWWGRGAIQTTGPNNYGLLQRDVISRLPHHDGVDLCTNPEAICQYDDIKYLGAIFYWANNVQGFTWPSQAATFLFFLFFSKPKAQEPGQRGSASTTSSIGSEPSSTGELKARFSVRGHSNVDCSTV